jgi:hypothetical protein
MAKFTLNFSCDNAAFDDYSRGEIARILRDVANRIQGTDYGVVYDSNGNQIGRFSYDYDEELDKDE